MVVEGQPVDDLVHRVALRGEGLAVLTLPLIDVVNIRGIESTAAPMAANLII